LNRFTAGFVLAAVLGTLACEDLTPTSTDPSLLPLTPITFEVRLPFSVFGSDLEAIGGFGNEAQLNTSLVAGEHQGVLNARAWMRFAEFPTDVVLADSNGIVVTDSMPAYVGGRVTVFIDTLTALYSEPPLLEALAFTEPWDTESVNWSNAVDTVADVQAWSMPGGGVLNMQDAVVWDPAEGDSLVFEVDSATVSAWADTTDASRGLVISTAEAGVRLELSFVSLNVDIRPSVNPDTLLERTIIVGARSFISDPPPPEPLGEIRIGGAPSWRSTFRVTLPDTLHGPEDLCETVGCPFELRAESVNFAALVLQSATSPPGFQPDDTLAFDARAALSEDNLPKSPLGTSLLGSSFGGLTGAAVPPEFFGDEPEGEVTVGITGYIQDLVRGETTRGDPAPTSISLLSVFEPLSLELMTFAGPGTEKEPYLRVILTTRVGVPLR
jgi:hypothetical protein